jgi:GTP-binding protein Era
VGYRAGYAALVGRPNVGKSTLLNRLLEHKLAITSHKPQTTRHRILGIRSRPDGQVVYVDTPGMHRRGSKAMNRYLNRTARSAIADVDVAVFVVQALTWTEEDEAVRATLEELGVPVVIAINKVDEVIPRERLLPYIAEIDRRCRAAANVPLSARTGENCAALEQEVLQRLPEGERIFPEDQLSDRPERFFAAELLREQIVRRYHQELPYAVTVEIEKFVELPAAVSIGAVIWVETESQRGIVIGRQGEALKAAATAAREQMARFFERRVRLDVWVKVKKSWSSDEQSLTQLGYTE